MTNNKKTKIQIAVKNTYSVQVTIPKTMATSKGIVAGDFIVFEEEEDYIKIRKLE